MPVLGHTHVGAAGAVRIATRNDGCRGNAYDRARSRGSRRHGVIGKEKGGIEAPPLQVVIKIGNVPLLGRVDDLLLHQLDGHRQRVRLAGELQRFANAGIEPRRLAAVGRGLEPGRCESSHVVGSDLVLRRCLLSQLRRPRSRGDVAIGNRTPCAKPHSRAITAASFSC